LKKKYGFMVIRIMIGRTDTSNSTKQIKKGLESII
jgi:hypothetical protein